MARKPKDIWGIPFPDANDVVEFMNRTVRTGQVASGDREALPGTADSYLNVRGVGQAISQVNDLANPYANTTKQLLGMASGNPGAEAKFAKSLAAETAWLAAGFGVGKAAGVGVKAARESGIAARAVNAATGKKVVVIGTSSLPGQPIIKGSMLPTVPDVVKPGQTLYPALKDTPVRWGFDPAKTRSMKELTGSVSEYSNRWYHEMVKVPKDLPGGGRTIDFGGWITPEIAVAKVPKSSLNYEPVMPSWNMTDEQIKAVEGITAGTGSVNNPVFRSGAIASTSPAKVVSTVSPVTPPGRHTVLPYGRPKTLDVVERELAKAIKLAGGKIPKK